MISVVYDRSVGGCVGVTATLCFVSRWTLTDSCGTCQDHSCFGLMCVRRCHSSRTTHALGLCVMCVCRCHSSRNRQHMPIQPPTHPQPLPPSLHGHLAHPLHQHPAPPRHRRRHALAVLRLAADSAELGAGAADVLGGAACMHGGSSGGSSM